MDGCTGLEWEKKNLQNVANKYSIAGATTWLTQLNAANFAGHDDWRLPRMASVGPIATDDPAELETILAAGGPPPRINPLFGPTAADSYWSGSRATPPPEYAPPGVKYPAGIHFGTGFPFFADLSFAAHVRAVRYASGVSTTSTTTSSTSVSSSTEPSSSSSSTTSTTQPGGASCGNGLLEPPGEQCDGHDDFACGGRCGADCQCPLTEVSMLRPYFARMTEVAHDAPRLMPIGDQPVAGQTYPAFLGVSRGLDSAVLELVSVARPDAVLSTTPLTGCDEVLLSGCLTGTVVIPAEPFTVRVRGEVQAQSVVSAPSTQVFSPAPASIEFLGATPAGFFPGTTSRLVYRMTNPGPGRSFTVSARNPGGGIVASPPRKSASDAAVHGLVGRHL